MSSYEDEIDLHYKYLITCVLLFPDDLLLTVDHMNVTFGYFLSSCFICRQRQL